VAAKRRGNYILSIDKRRNRGVYDGADSAEII